MLPATAETFLNTKTLFTEKTLVTGCNLLPRNLIHKVGNLPVNKVFNKR